MVTCPWHDVGAASRPVLLDVRRLLRRPDDAEIPLQSEIMFTVRDRRPAGIVYMSSVNTYQAYNNFPYDPPAGFGWDDGAHPLTGRSLYDFNSPATHRYPDGKPAVKVTFDRPYSSQYGNPGNGGLTDFEPIPIAFLEKRGYDVTYITDVDADANPSTLLSHKVVLIVRATPSTGPWRMYDGAYAARDAGVNLAFITSNEIYWQVRYRTERRRTPAAHRGRLQGLQARPGRRPGAPHDQLARPRPPRAGARRRAAPHGRLPRLGRPAARAHPHATLAVRGHRPAGRRPGQRASSPGTRSTRSIRTTRRPTRCGGYCSPAPRSRTSWADAATRRTCRSTARTRGRSCSRRARWTGRGGSRRVEAATARTTTSGRSLKRLTENVLRRMLHRRR